MNRLAEFAQDAGFALRGVRRSVSSTFSIVAILALGTGAATAVFSLYNTVVLSPLQTGNARRLVWIENNRRDASDGDVTTGAYFAWRDASRTLQQLATIANTSATLTGNDAPVRLEGAAVGDGLLPALGVRADLGRVFAARDYAAGETPVMLLSRKVWRSRFHGDSATVGRTLMLDGVVRTVVGIMPPAADLFDDGLEFWIPSELSAASRNNFITPRLQVIGLLAPGVSVAAAEKELTTILSAADTRPDRASEPVTARVIRLDERLGGAFRSRLLLVFAAVGCVLAAGCANVASLLLARGASRQRELAIRTSLGASRGRLVRQLLTENVLLAVAAGGLGLTCTNLLLLLLKRVLPAGLPHLATAHMNGAAALFALLVTCLCCIVVGLVPAWRVSRVDVRSTLQSGGRGVTGGGDRLRRALMVGEVCMATLLLVTAGLLTRSAAAVDRVPLGFSADSVLSARFSLPADRYGTPDAVVAAQSRLLEQLQAANAPAPVAIVSRIPLVSLGISYDFAVADRAVTKAESVNAAVVLASPGYFTTMRMRLTAGRDFESRDQHSSPRVAIVNAEFARRLKLGDRALGAQLSGLGRAFNDRNGRPTPWEIVGVAADTRDWGSRNETRPQIYLPYTQTPDEVWQWTNRTSVVVARVGAEPLQALGRLQAAVQRIDGSLPLYDVEPMEARVHDANATERAYTILLLILAGAALVLATAGIYAMLSHAVGQRVPEIGVRIALGATPAHILRLVLRWALGLTSTGIALGLALSVSVTHLLSAMLFGVGATDVITFAAASAVMIATALITCVVPARRALAVAPDEELRAGG